MPCDICHGTGQLNENGITIACPNCQRSAAADLISMAGRSWTEPAPDDDDGPVEVHEAEPARQLRLSHVPEAARAELETKFLGKGGQAPERMSHAGQIAQATAQHALDLERQMASLVEDLQVDDDTPKTTRATFHAHQVLLAGQRACALAIVRTIEAAALALDATLASDSGPTEPQQPNCPECGAAAEPIAEHRGAWLMGCTECDHTWKAASN